MERFQQVMPTGRQGLEWRDDRKVTNGILFVLQPCIPWRDLPESYGPVTVGYNSDNRWRRSGDRSAIPEPLSFQGGKASGHSLPARRLPLLLLRDSSMTPRCRAR